MARSPNKADNVPSADDRKTYPAEKARQGTIILRHWWSRAIFIAGLVAAALLAIIWSAAA